MKDVHVRARLRTMLGRSFVHDPSAVIIDELGICQGRVRVDLAAVNGDLYGYEIKAAADSLVRLETQIKAYSLVLDFAAVVLAEKHLEAAQERLPSWWGVYVAEAPKDAFTIHRVREPKRNPAIDPRRLVELLWHDDALRMLEARDALRGVRTKPRAYAWDRLCEVCSLDEIRGAVRQRIKDRKARRSATSRA